MRERRESQPKWAMVDLNNGRRTVTELKDIFVGNVFPEVGDEIKLVCIERTRTSLRIGLQVVGKDNADIPKEERKGGAADVAGSSRINDGSPEGRPDVQSGH